MRVLVLVNGEPDRLDGVRARDLFQDLAADQDVVFLYRGDTHKMRALWRFCRIALTTAPDVIYVEAFGYAGVVAALLAKGLRGSRMVASYGDAIFAFALGRFTLPKALIAGALEWTMQRSADRLIVRGPYHREILQNKGLREVEWIPDGVDPELFRPLDSAALRTSLGLRGRVTVGVIGSINVSPKSGFCYGRDVIEVVRRVDDPSVAGIIVGAGDGLPLLRDLVRQYGLEDRIVLTGWIPHQELPAYINAIDVCLSTQTNDLVGTVRLTAKLPQYLACGRYVIASDVGGAREFVRDAGALIPASENIDEAYLDRVAAHVREVLERPAMLEKGRAGVDIARRYFDYSALRPRLAAALSDLVA